MTRGVAPRPARPPRACEGAGRSFPARLRARHTATHRDARRREAERSESKVVAHRLGHRPGPLAPADAALFARAHPTPRPPPPPSDPQGRSAAVEAAGVRDYLAPPRPPVPLRPTPIPTPSVGPPQRRAPSCATTHVPGRRPPGIGVRTQAEDVNTEPFSRPGDPRHTGGPCTDREKFYSERSGWDLRSSTENTCSYRLSEFEPNRSTPVQHRRTGCVVSQTIYVRGRHTPRATRVTQSDGHVPPGHKGPVQTRKHRCTNTSGTVDKHTGRDVYVDRPRILSSSQTSKTPHIERIRYTRHNCTRNRPFTLSLRRVNPSRPVVELYPESTTHMSLSQGPQTSHTVHKTPPQHSSPPKTFFRIHVRPRSPHTSASHPTVLLLPP